MAHDSYSSIVTNSPSDDASETQDPAEDKDWSNSQENSSTDDHTCQDLTTLLNGHSSPVSSPINGGSVKEAAPKGACLKK